MTRRVEALALDLPRLSAGAREVSSEAVDPRDPIIGRRRLDGVDAPNARTAEAGAGSRPERADAGAAPALPSLGGRSLEEVLLDFVAPRVDAPGLMRRSIAILQHCAAEIVPKLEGGEQLRTLARNLIEDEIARHRDLLHRLQRGGEI